MPQLVLQYAVVLSLVVLTGWALVAACGILVQRVPRLGVWRLPRARLAVLLVCACAALVYGRKVQRDGIKQRDIYVDGSAETSGDGLSWSTPFKTIQEAVDQVGMDDTTIHVKRGVYSPVMVDNTCLFGMIIPFTFTVEATDGPVLTVIDGAGGYCCVGHVFNEPAEWCGRFRGFTLRNAENGGVNGTYIGCFARDCGTGFAAADLVNCRMSGNSSCGASGCNLYYCTVAGNHAPARSWWRAGDPAGVVDCRAYNSIVWGNTVAGETANHACADQSESDPLLRGCCTFPMPGGASLGNMASDPRLFAADFGDLRLRDDSPCRDAGDASVVPVDVAEDALGRPRVQGAAPDLGALEGDYIHGFVLTTDVRRHGRVTPAYALAQPGTSVTFSIRAGERALDHLETNGVPVPAVSRFTWENVQGDGVLRVVSRPETFYVDAEKGDDANDGRAPETAVATIPAAVARTLSGDTVKVAPGVYPPFSANGNIFIESLGGASRTAIDGAGTGPCVGLGGDVHGPTTLRGFTVRNGWRSVATGGTAGIEGGAAEDCVISNCTAWCGGGASGARLLRCLVTDNEAGCEGGGIRNSWASRCVIAGNRVTGHGAYAPGGGGCSEAVLDSCLVVSNSVGTPGCGYRGFGAGVSMGELRNCTVVGNFFAETSASNGVGTRTARVYNSIVWGNGAGDAVQVDGGTAVCVWTNGAPGFVDASSGDYRLRPDSPCIDAGATAEATGLDLAGGLRVRGGAVDLGCHEFVPAVADTNLTAGIRVPAEWLETYFPLDRGRDADAVYQALVFAPSRNPRAASDGTNACMSVLESYAWDLDPTDPSMTCRATIAMTNGVAEIGVSHMSSNRVYSLLGSPSLTDAVWTRTTDFADTDFLTTNHFFRVGVGLPNE